MIAICTPFRETVNGKFSFDLVQLIQGLWVHGHHAIYAIGDSSILPNQRTGLAEKATEHDADVLFIDSDMRFSSMAWKPLLDSGFDIIGANCRQRADEKKWTAWKNGWFISSEGRTGIEEVEKLGFGFTLIRSRVFKKVPKPWFAMPWDGQRHVGEDQYFCHVARNAGFKIHIDHDVSQLIKHIHSVELGV